MAVRTVERNDLNLSDADVISAISVVTGIAANAQRREHTRNHIVGFGWKDSTIVIQCDNRGAAVHLANTLGFPTKGRGAHFLLPRQGEISGVTVVIDYVYQEPAE